MAQFRALAVDDDPDILDSLTSGLEALGFEVFQAVDGADAQRILTSETNIDILLTDFQMPNVDGPELLTWCRQSGSHFPVVLLSSKFALHGREKLALCDCCAFLLYKPFGLETLNEVVTVALERRHLVACPKVANANGS